MCLFMFSETEIFTSRMCLTRGEKKKKPSVTHFFCRGCMKLRQIHVELGKQRAEQTDSLVPKNVEC